MTNERKELLWRAVNTPPEIELEADDKTYTATCPITGATAQYEDEEALRDLEIQAARVYAVLNMHDDEIKKLSFGNKGFE